MTSCHGMNLAYGRVRTLGSEIEGKELYIRSAEGLYACYNKNNSSLPQKCIIFLYL